MQSLLIRFRKPLREGGRIRLARAAGLAGLMLAATAGIASAQSGAAPKTAWDGVYSEAQATRATTSFGQSCAGCHSLGSDGRAPLAGDAFWKSFSQKSVGDLVDFVTNYMPNGSPHTLTDSTYADIVALILKSNGFPAGKVDLERTAVSKVQIVPRDGSSELPADSLAHVVGCLAKSGDDWVVSSATNPERAENASAPDATRPLGKRTMTLKFVLTKMDSWIGARVAVNGILIGANGADGINVTTVNRVAEKCP